MGALAGMDLAASMCCAGHVFCYALHMRLPGKMLMQLASFLQPATRSTCAASPCCSCSLCCSQKKDKKEKKVSVNRGWDWVLFDS